MGVPPIAYAPAPRDRDPLGDRFFIRTALIFVALIVVTWAAIFAIFWGR